jgi:adenylate cyclase
MADDILLKINFSDGRLFILDFFLGAELSTIKLSSELHKNGIKSVFIISSSPVEASGYISLINFFKSSSASVKSNHIAFSYPENISTVQNTITEISNCTADGPCLLVSYGNSYARTFAAALIRPFAPSLDEAVKTVSIKSSGFDKTEDINIDREFLNEYYSIDNEFEPYLELISISENEKINEEKIPAEISKTETSAAQTLAVKDTSADVNNLNETKPLENNLYTLDMNKKTNSVSSDVKPSESFLQKEDLKKEETKKEKIKKEAKQEKIKEEKKYERRILDRETPFYISLKFKLISIISVIIILSLSGMIFLASYYFRKDNMIRIEENNLKLSEITASRVFSEIDKSRIIALTMLNEIDSKSADSSMVDFTRTDVLFAGIIDDSTGVKFAKKTYNAQLLSKYQIQSENLDEVSESSVDVFKRAFAGETVMHNVSQSLDFPVLALILPYKRSEGKEIASIMVSYIKLDTLLKSFESRGTIIFFMVNSKGDVIAHPDPKVVLSGANYSRLSIVESMFKSKTDNGNVRYKNDLGIVYLGSFKKIEFGGSGVIAAVEEEKVLEEVNNLQRRNVYLMVIVLASAILIVFFYGRSITGPIIRLVGATREIIKGNFHINIKASSKDEIGNLTDSFIQMGRGLEEREKIKDAFGKFVNKDLAEQVMKGTIKLGGERKEVAVFFSDIRSFTAISEKLEPEEVVEFLNQYMTRMVKCVNDTKGVVDKYIGDAIMAVWGAPVSTGNDTENAINGALMMRKTLAEFNTGRGGDKHPVIRIGCGINTGPVLAGQIGSEERMEYTVIGDTVNLASRIESLNKPFGTDILISEDAYKKVKEIFAIEKMQSIKVKGKSEAQNVYAVLGRLDDPSRPKSLSEVRINIGLDPKKFEESTKNNGTFEDEEVKYEIIDK